MKLPVEGCRAITVDQAVRHYVAGRITVEKLEAEVERILRVGEPRDPGKTERR